MEYSQGTQNLSVTMNEADPDSPRFFYYQYIAWKRELEDSVRLKTAYYSSRGPEFRSQQLYCAF